LTCKSERAKKIHFHVKSCKEGTRGEEEKGPIQAEKKDLERNPARVETKPTLPLSVRER